MRVLMLVMSDVDRDARVRREATTLASAGHAVTIVALRGAVPGCTVIPTAASSPFPGGGVAGRGRLRFLRRVARWALLPQHEAALRRSFAARAWAAARGLDVDVVHAHDVEVLEPAERLRAHHGAGLVYDAHECWSGRVRRGRPAPLRHRRDLAVEARLGGAADAVLTVGEELAAWLRSTFGWQHVTVVRNTFPQASAAAGAPGPRGLVYAGRVGPGRDLETVARGARRAGMPLVVIGPGDAPTRRRLAVLPGVDVRNAVAVEDVPGVYREGGVAVVSADAGPLNHAVSQPNKLFHAVQAGVPVVATDLPAHRRLLERYAIGELYAAGDATSFAEATRRVVERWDELVLAVHAAAPQLSWEVDAGRLLGVYETLASAGEGRAAASSA